MIINIKPEISDLVHMYIKPQYYIYVCVSTSVCSTFIHCIYVMDFGLLNIL